MSGHLVREALAAALLCQRAYEEHSGSVDELEYLIEGHTIAIRGTEASKLLSGLGVVDVVRDLRITPWRDHRVGWAHAGMLKGARALFEVLEPEIEYTHGIPCFRGSQYISVVGHSLGGGVGLILAHIMHHAGMLVDFTGFGTPRCMISKLNPRVNTHFYRNGDDGVTEVPRWWMGGYRRLPNVQIGDRGGYEVISDHDIRAYVRSLRRMV
jgi:hypothetical protein